MRGVSKTREAIERAQRERTLRAIEQLSYLNTQRFPTSVAVDIAGITLETLDNYLRKSKLFLCAKTRKGAKRKLPLIDVYQIVLMAEFSRLNNYPTATAGYLNEALFSDATCQMYDWKNASEPEITKTSYGHHSAIDMPLKGDPYAIPGRFREDIFSTPPAYWHRDRNQPIFAIGASRFDIGINWTAERPDLDDSYNPTAIICNVTALLTRVDHELFQQTDRGREEATDYQKKKAKDDARLNAILARKRKAKSDADADETLEAEDERERPDES